MKKVMGFVIALALSGCGEDSVVPDDTVIPDKDVNVEENAFVDDEEMPDEVLDATVSPDADTAGPGYQLIDVEYVKLSGSSNLALKWKRYEIFRDHEALENFLTQIESQEIELPEIDFEKKMVIAVFNGEWPDMAPIYDVTGIKKMVFDDPKDIYSSVLVVETMTRYRSDHSCGVNLAFYYPLYLIIVEKAGFVNFVDRFEIQKC